MKRSTGQHGREERVVSLAPPSFRTSFSPWGRSSFDSLMSYGFTPVSPVPTIPLLTVAPSIDLLASKTRTARTGAELSPSSKLAFSFGAVESSSSWERGERSRSLRRTEMTKLVRKRGRGIRRGKTTRRSAKRQRGGRKGKVSSKPSSEPFLPRGVEKERTH